MTDESSIEQLEREAERLYRIWRDRRTKENWRAYLKVKERLDALREKSR